MGVELTQESEPPEPVDICGWEAVHVPGGLKVISIRSHRRETGKGPFRYELARAKALYREVLARQGWNTWWVAPLPESVTEPLQETGALRSENERLRRENDELRAQLQRLSAERRSSESRFEVATVSDPYAEWIERHRDVLANHPDSYFAVDVENDTIVERSQNRAELNRKLMALFKDDEGAWSRLLIVDASLYF
ncbi:hypothetical protein [Archangium sp.]|uniref:hypothetical protein n=1 Tax=Archangium sp. TaxID=1872627 RepID=UPI00286B094E|nr:hypothetical protein [Archangium sp.]